MKLFAGIALGAGVRDAGLNTIQALERAAFDARYEPAEKLHATLAFLGHVEHELVSRVAAVLSDVAAATQPFEFKLDKLAAFPSEVRPRIIYLGSRAPNPPFRALCDRLRVRYRELGFDFHDDAVLHVTIARKKGPSLRPLPLISPKPVTMAVHEIVLFESITEERKTRYEIRERASLRSG